MCDIGVKLKKALLDQQRCDVKLMLKSGDCFHCHSLILALNGHFFESKLKDEWIGQGSCKEIICDQFEDEFVIGIVRYMYGILCPLSIQNIEHFLACSDYFGVDEFSQKCESFIIENISFDNAFRFFRIADSNAREECRCFCFDFIHRNFENCIFDNGDFCLLSPQLVASVVKHASVNAHEEFLFDCLITYAEVIDSDDILSVCADYTRFTSMTLEYFVAKCVLRSFLHEDRKKQILLYFSSLQHSVQDIFPQHYIPPREIVLDSDILVRRAPFMSVDATWQCNDLNGDRVKFQCSNTMKLKAIAVYGLPLCSLFYTLSVHLSSTEQLLGQCSCRLDFTDDEHFKYIRLKKCLTIEQNNFYTLVLTFKGQKTFFGRNCFSSTVVEKGEENVQVTFETAQCGSSSVDEGQFYGLLFCG